MKNTYPAFTDQEIKALLLKHEITTQFDEEGDIEHLRGGLDALAKILIDGDLKIGLNDRWFRYYPQNKELTQWVANDGSVLDKTLTVMILEHYEGDFVKNLMEFEEYNYGDLEYFLCKKR